LALQHHERLDGSGYPDGLKGDELSIEVRILAVCNVVNAMSLRHPYCPARSKQEITEEITNGKGTRYDPDVVNVLLEMIGSGELELAKG
jgi:HD-GYP domain-containing protein (c-di-GMP phosphodiesterase class II)